MELIIFANEYLHFIYHFPLNVTNNTLTNNSEDLEGLISQA